LVTVQLELERLRAAGPEGFQGVADAMPQLVWTADPAGTVTYVNRQWIEYTGFTAERLAASDGAAGIVHPSDVDQTWDRWNAALAETTAYETEYRLRRASDGSYHWFLARAVPVFGDDGRVLSWVGTATDIDGQRRLHDSLRFIVAAGSLLSSNAEIDEICESLTKIAIEHVADWCFIALCVDDRIVTTAVAHKNQSLLNYVEQVRDRYPIRPQDSIARVIADNEPLLIERVLPEQLEAAAQDPEHLEILQALHVHSVMLLPLATADGVVYGALGLMSSDYGRSFDAVDLETAETVAAQAAIAIADGRARAKERDATKGLRFAARVNELLLETDDFRLAVARIAETVAEEIADACGVLRVTDNAVRVQVIAHRDPAIAAILSKLAGQRPLRPAAERELAARMRRHRTIVFDAGENARLKAAAWPHLSEEFDLLDPVTTAIVPVFWGTTTYGALAAYFSAREFDSDRDLPLLEEAADRISVAIEKAEILERERHIGATLQQALLPTLIPQPAGIHFDAVYAPATGEGQLGGDWYDAIELDDGSVVISVGDVTGRGVEAAAIMSKVRHAMGMAPLHQSDPARVLDAAEWFLRKRYPDALVTAFVGVVSPDRRTLRYASAGHPRPLLRRDDGLIELVADGLPLGLRHVAPGEASRSIELHTGDVLVLYTDGLTEWSRDTSDGERHLEEIVRNEVMTVSTSPAKLIERACVPEDAPDDIAILTVSLGNAPLWSYISEDARVAAHARREFIEFLRERAADGTFLARAELVFGELLGNVVRHAPGPVEIAVFQRKSRWELHVIDSGRPFSPSRALPNDPFSERGRGLFIVQQLAANVRILPIGRCGNHIVVTL
jgi:PAS domain S-box-containing protein